MKRGVEGGVSVMRGAMLGADVALEGLDSVRELPGACLGPRPLSLTDRAQALGRDIPYQTWSSALFLANSIKFFFRALDLVFL